MDERARTDLDFEKFCNVSNYLHIMMAFGIKRIFEDVQERAQKVIRTCLPPSWYSVHILCRMSNKVNIVVT